MSKPIIPEGYKPCFSTYDTQKAIEFIKLRFAHNLCAALDLHRVSAPLFLPADTGLNDDLNGVERAVSFDIPVTGQEYQVVQSLAKWKRWALKAYEFPVGKGLYTDMNAIRRDEERLDNIHSAYVDQWDWEKVMRDDERNEDFLKDIVTRIVNAICHTADEFCWEFKNASVNLEREVAFVTTQQLADMFPELTASERETEFLKDHHTAFIMQVGKRLIDGTRHDGRAPDYDDWELNGDIMFWDETLNRALEISSMGIRVNKESLAKQLKEAGCEERLNFPFHKALMEGNLPQTIGGGIGQSRLCMLLMGCAHIGEVQAGVWTEETKKECLEKGVVLL